jgi:hypothetical protein
MVLISRGREAGLGFGRGGGRPYIRHGKKEFNASEGYKAGTVDCFGYVTEARR